MGYILVNDFTGGVDRSRPRYAAVPGTLWSGINGHLTRGGDFEKRKAFVATYSLPAGTVGLAKTAAGLYVFGHTTEAALPSTLPAGILYQQIAHPTSPALALRKILSWDLFNGQLYVIAKFENGDIRHYFNGTTVADWNAQAGNTPTTGWGTIVRTFKRKLYSSIMSILWGSQIDTATGWDTSSGAFFQNMSNHQSGSDEVTGLTVYQNYLAIFSRRVIQIWSMVDNSANNAPVQTLYETGTRSPRSVIGFGDVDAFYLSDSGIRSIRARNVTNVAGVNDVGTPIDSLIREWIEGFTDEQVEDAVAAVEPLDGRYWLAIGDRIAVFTYFPSKKISAWSWYEPGVEFKDIVTVNDRVYCRADDVIYLYGGADNATYDSNTPVTAALGFLTGGKPGHFKQIKGIDISAQGEWNVKLLVNPNDENEFVDVGNLTNWTFQDMDSGAGARCSAVAPVLTNDGAGYAVLSQIAIHHNGADTPP